MKRAYQKGFTIIELMVVIVVIAILATVVLVGYNIVQQDAYRSKMESYSSQIKNHMKAYRSLNHGSYYTKTSTTNLHSVSDDFAEIGTTGGDSSTTAKYVSSNDGTKMCVHITSSKSKLKASIHDKVGKGVITAEISDTAADCTTRVLP